MNKPEEHLENMPEQDINYNARRPMIMIELEIQDEGKRRQCRRRDRGVLR